MLQFIKNIFKSESFKKAMLNALIVNNPRLNAADYLEINNLIRKKERNVEINEAQMKIRKAS